LLIDNQTITKDKKRADILALDKLGNLVVIELKKDKAKVGVEMQALQYLADFSSEKGQKFIDKFKKLEKDKKGFKEPAIEDAVKGFIDVDIQEINKKQRIILIAQKFDNSLLSMGEWLSRQGVAFRCLEYNQLVINNKKFLSFSVYFDRSSEEIFKLRFDGKDSSVLSRSLYETPQIYWHNIGLADSEWWEIGVNNKFIATSFDNAPGDRGETILKSYIKGDKVIAYAKGFGVVGWGVVKNPDSYKLVELSGKEDYAKGELRHRLDIEWETSLKLEDGIKADELKKDFQIYPPVQTSSMIKSKVNAERLIEEINSKAKL
jgi:phage-related protein